jgi:hypothetical protein
MLQLLEHGADARIVNLRGRSVANLAKGPVLQALREYQLRLQAVPAYAVVEMPGGERAFIQMSQTAAAELAECFENADRSAAAAVFDTGPVFDTGSASDWTDAVEAFTGFSSRPRRPSPRQPPPPSPPPAAL